MGREAPVFALRVWRSDINKRWQWDILYCGWAHIANNSGIETEEKARKEAGEFLDAIAAAAKQARKQ